MQNQKSAFFVPREGWTSGTSAAAALSAALELALTGRVSASAEAPLPPFPPFSPSCPPARGAVKWVSLPVSQAAFGPAPGCGSISRKNALTSHAAVIKDGGDDPDVTSGLPISVTLTAFPGDEPPFSQNFIRIRAGSGVGVVTKPGLALPVGEPAINPIPRTQLLCAASFYFAAWLKKNPGSLKPALNFEALISVPGGEEAAAKTLNPKLGIIGGISILGSKGIVRPYSCAAWARTIKLEIAAARAGGCEALCLCTGRKTEECLKAVFSDLPPASFVQAADLAALSTILAGRAGFKKIIWGCFFGKLCKLAQGLPTLHAHAARLDLDFLSSACGEAGMTDPGRISRCNTAREALSLILAERPWPLILRRLLFLAKKTLEKYAGRPVRLHLFHYDGSPLASL